jgi:hypothetical protein
MNQTPKSVRGRFFVGLGHAIHLAGPVLSMILAIQVAFGLLAGFVEGWSVGDALYISLSSPASRLVMAILCRDRRSRAPLR